MKQFFLKGASVAISIGFGTSAVFGMTSPRAFIFSDVPLGAWYASYIANAVDAGIVSGYADSFGRPTGYFGPADPVTMGESLKIVLLGAGYDTSAGVGYGHWAAKYVSVAQRLNFQVAQSQPLTLDRPATRAEVSSLLTDAFGIPLVYTNSSFLDVTEETPYAASVEALNTKNIVSGDTDAAGVPTGKFRPLASIQRAEMMKMIMETRAQFGTPGANDRSSSSSSSTGACTLSDCGPAPMMPNWECTDGSKGGPSCERHPDGRCVWLIRQCPFSSSSSSSSSSSHVPQTHVIHFSEIQGFQPSFISIRVGDTIRFRNDTAALMWVASNPHPTHSDLSGFDSHAGIGVNGEYSYVFTKVGTWGYHNHLNSNQQGVVSVDSN